MADVTWRVVLALVAPESFPADLTWRVAFPSSHQSFSPPTPADVTHRLVFPSLHQSFSVQGLAIKYFFPA